VNAGGFVRLTNTDRRPEGVVVVDRTTPWGNPFRVGTTVTITVGGSIGTVVLAIPDNTASVALYDLWVCHSPDPAAAWIRDNIGNLAGRTLGCWCDPNSPDPCHARSLARFTAEGFDGRLPLGPATNPTTGR